MEKRKVIIWLIVLFSVIGAVLASYALWAHYDEAEHEICNISDTFNCDIVNKSQYSEVLGVPVALMGLLTYVFFFFAILYYRKDQNETLMNLMAFGAIAGLSFSLYLTYIEAYVLYAWCIICLGSQFTILTVTILMFWLKKIDQKKYDRKSSIE